MAKNPKFIGEPMVNANDLLADIGRKFIPADELSSTILGGENASL
jgi:hypothetical protein